MPVFRVRELEREHGDLHDVIPQLVNIHGQSKAGELLGVCSATINKWLKEHHYRKVIMYVRDEEKSS